MKTLPDTTAFQDLTKHVVREGGNFLIKFVSKQTTKKKGRGGISTIDDALDRWHLDKNKPAGDQAIALYLLFKACRRWLKTHRAKTNPGPSTPIRIAEVEKLLTDVEGNLIELVPLFGQFEQRKRTRGVDQHTKSLHGVYQHERSIYLGRNKTSAPSGTLLHGNFDEKLHKKFKGKTFSTLSEQDYLLLDKIVTSQSNKSPEVLYLNKLQRLSYLVQVNGDDGLLYDATGALFNTHAPKYWKKGKYWAWTMDQYGNLFSVEDMKLMDDTGTQFNHSSFNSGREVICGGLIEVINGKLNYIDNSSGHYQPDSRQLLQAIINLETEGCDLANITVGVMAPPKSTPNEYKLDAFRHLVLGTLPQTTSTWVQGVRDNL